MNRFSSAALGLVGVLALAGCSDTEGTGDKGYISGDGSIHVIDADERDAPIDMSGETLDGEELDIADLRGSVVVVNVWGSWCAPCREEQPDLVEVAHDTADMAEFVGVNIRDNSPDNSRAFVRNFEVPYPSIYSPDARALLGFAGTLTPSTIPATVILDSQGRTASYIIGTVTSPSTLRGLIEDVAAEDG